MPGIGTAREICVCPHVPPSSEGIQFVPLAAGVWASPALPALTQASHVRNGMCRELAPEAGGHRAVAPDSGLQKGLLPFFSCHHWLRQAHHPLDPHPPTSQTVKGQQTTLHLRC